MFKMSPAGLQTFIGTPNCVLEDHVRYSTVQIPNVFCDGHLQLINCVGILIVSCHRLCDHSVQKYIGIVKSNEAKSLLLERKMM